jgi:hypothetical protein
VTTWDTIVDDPAIALLLLMLLLLLLLLCYFAPALFCFVSQRELLLSLASNITQVNNRQSTTTTAQHKVRSEI